MEALYFPEHDWHLATYGSKLILIGEVILTEEKESNWQPNIFKNLEISVLSYREIPMQSCLLSIHQHPFSWIEIIEIEEDPIDVATDNAFSSYFLTNEDDESDAESQTSTMKKMMEVMKVIIDGS